MTLLKVFSRKPELQSMYIFYMYVYWTYILHVQQHLEITAYYFYGFEIISERKIPQKSQGERTWVGQKATISCLLQNVFTNTFPFSFQQISGSLRSRLGQSLHFILISFTKMLGGKKAAFLKKKGHFEISVIAWNTNWFC